MIQATTTKERPILFSSAMVRAILAGHKTQTRRAVKAPAPYVETDRGIDVLWATGQLSCPYGRPGDRLWVREAWQLAYLSVDHETGYADDCKVWISDIPPANPDGWVVCYAADDEHELGDRFCPSYRPSIHMPRWASRITLEVVNVRVERVNSISYDDAMAEGVDRCNSSCGWIVEERFRRLWDSINGKTYPWASNPWVWVVEFKQVDAKSAMQGQGQESES